MSHAPSQELQLTSFLAAGPTSALTPAHATMLCSLSYPLDVSSTEFKLVATYNGWEYVILAHELGDAAERPDRTLFVTVIEFESVAVVLGNLGIRISLVAYPVVCVQKHFLDDVREQLKNNPNFKGILTGR